MTPNPVERGFASAAQRRRRRAALRRSAAEASNRRAAQRTGSDDRERTRSSDNAYRADQTLWPDSVANPRRTRK